MSKDHCYALVMSGGGSNGAWEAGVLWGLHHYGDQKEYEWDVVTGVSAGAINTSAVVMFSPDDPGMAQFISDTWVSLTDKDIWQIWPDEKHALTERPSLLDNSNLGPFLQSIITQFPEGYKRKFTLTAVDVENGDYFKFDEVNTVVSELHQAAVSSASIPVFFTPNHYKDRYFIDGGTVWGVNVDSAIEKCLEIVDSPDKITVDVLLCGDKPQPIKSKNTTISNWQYANDLHKFYDRGHSIVEQMMAYPAVNYRHLFVQQVMATNELEFSNEATWPLQEEGRQNAKDMLQKEEGYGFRKL